MDKLEKKFEEQKNETWGCNKINPEYCKTCSFKNGEPPFADSPLKAYCVIYSREKGMSKPKSVYYDGGRCEYYSDENESNENEEEN